LLISLLLSLYVVSGGIFVSGDILLGMLRGVPFL